jgi:hypothetical protein
MISNRRNTLRIAFCEQIESRTLLSVARPAYNTGTGFFVSGGNVYDANGELFVQKGINAVHAWGSYNTNYNAIDQIAKTGANTIRTVMYQNIAADPTNNWTDSTDTVARRKAVVERYLANGIVAVVEDHASIQDSSSQSSTTALAEITTHWLDNSAWLKQYESGIILNIANEWGPVTGAIGSNTVWRDSYIAQVTRLRQGLDGVVGTADDITNLIEIDAAGWGQDFNSLALHAQAIQDADPQHNIVFSIHLYGQWRDESRPWEVAGGNTDYGPWDVYSRLNALRTRANPLPLVIGEFAWEDFRDFSNSSAPYSNYRTRRVLEIADQLGIGWTGWSYNQSSPTTLNVLAGSLNNTNYTTNESLSDWGDALVNDVSLGLKATAKRATIFPIVGLPAAPAGLNAMPVSAPAAMKLVLEKTRGRIAEGGATAVGLKLSAVPTSPITVTLSKATGDTDLALATTTLIFTADNWNVFQPILVNAAADADATIGSARFNVAATGLATTDFTLRETDAQLPIGSATLAPTADRGYAGNGTVTSLSVTSTASPQPTGALFMKFDTSGRGGRATSATLRVFKVNATSNMTMRLYLALTDSWTEGSTNGIHASIFLQPKVVPNAANTYVEFDVSAIVASELYKDGLITFALTTAGSTATIQTREGANAPQLVINTVEAVPPKLLASTFDYAPATDRLVFQFDEDVSASLSNVDLLLESITSPGELLTVSASPTYDAGTNTAAFAFTAGSVPSGRYRVTLIASGVNDSAGNAMLVNSSLDFFSLLGDADRDGTVGFSDLVTLSQHYNGAGTYADGDFDGDGSVGFSDLVILSQNYNDTVGLPAPIVQTAPSETRPAKRVPTSKGIVI